MACARGAFLTVAAAALALGSSGAAAQTEQRPIGLKAGEIEAGEIEAGEAFGCRIPIEIEYDGTPPLRQFRVIAKAYRGDRELASTGIADGDRTLVAKPVPGGLAYVPVPLQFGLSAATCRQIDGLRITFARCVFGTRAVDDCRAHMRFTDARPGDPLYLALD